MILRETLDIIRFNTSTLDELSGRAANGLFSDSEIVMQLQLALDKYAAQTQAIEGIYSFPLSTNTSSFTAPPRALRTKTYRFTEAFIQGVKYPVNVSNLNSAETYFRYEWAGVPRWMVAWQGNLNIYPTTSSASYNTSTLTAAIGALDTTIPVAATSGFLNNDGRITIGNEKIVFGYSDDTNFYDCQRGAEETIPTAHDVGSVVADNDFHIYYYKLHWKIPVFGNSIPEYALDREMEVCDEHLQIVTDYTSFRLLSKIDPNRAAPYKVEFDDWLVVAKSDIKMGRSATGVGGGIRPQFFWENGDPYTYLL